MDENAMDIGRFHAALVTAGLEALRNHPEGVPVRVVTPDGTYNIGNVGVSEDGMSIDIVVIEAEE